MMDWACLLWDVDGTLTDTTTLIAEALDHIYQRHYGRTLSFEDRRALIGTPLKKQIRVFGEPEEFGTDEQTVMADFIDYYEARRSRETIHQPVIDILIGGKRRGLPTGLVTSKNQEELANTLPRLGIVDYVDATVTADDVPHPKPAPDGILFAMRQLSIPTESAHRTVYIGDTTHDMQAAKGAGVHGIAVTWGAATRAMMEAISPDSICDSPDELRALLHF